MKDIKGGRENPRPSIFSANLREAIDASGAQAKLELRRSERLDILLDMVGLEFDLNRDPHNLSDKNPIDMKTLRWILMNSRDTLNPTNAVIVHTAHDHIGVNSTLLSQKLKGAECHDRVMEIYQEWLERISRDQP